MAWLDAFRHWLAVWTGTVNEPGPQYGFWSGFGGDIAVVGALLSAPLVLLRKHNCHQHGCLRIGRFQVADGKFVTCRRHHPDAVIRGGVRPRHILAAHREHLEHAKGGTT